MSSSNPVIVISTMLASMSKSEVEAVGKTAAEVLNTKQNSRVYALKYTINQDDLIAGVGKRERSDKGRARGNVGVWGKTLEGIDFSRRYLDGRCFQGSFFNDLQTTVNKLSENEVFVLGMTIDRANKRKAFALARKKAGSKMIIGPSGFFSSAHDDQLDDVELLVYGEDGNEKFECKLVEQVSSDEILEDLKKHMPEEKRFRYLRKKSILGVFWKAAKLGVGALS